MKLTLSLSILLIGIISLNAISQELPTRVNNAENKYFRSIFNQSNNECSQASSIGYLFSYEMNAARNTDGKLNTNTYPTHYTYNFLNDGSGSNEALSDEGFKIAIDNGIPDINTYGGSLKPLGVTGWMNGYSKYLIAMKNRASSFNTYSSSNEANINKMKQWLSNHEGATTGFGGLLVANTFLGSWKFAAIPSGKYEAGKQVLYVTTKTMTSGHTFTIVGYDDNIQFDINGDGQITRNIDINGDGKVDTRDWEDGAFIVANSYGANWKNSGFVYYMYQACANFPNGIYALNVLPNYTPKLTLKTSISCNKRKKINIKAGISADQNATTPQYTKTFSAFNYKSGGLIPMIDQNNSNPIEIGLDITDLIDKVSDLSSSKLFLQVITDNDNTVTGAIQSLSCISYISKVEGEEFISSVNGENLVPGTTTTVSVLPVKTNFNTTVAINNYSISLVNKILKIEGVTEKSTIKGVGINGDIIFAKTLYLGTNTFEVDLNNKILIVEITNTKSVYRKKLLVM